MKLKIEGVRIISSQGVIAEFPNADEVIWVGWRPARNGKNARYYYEARYGDLWGGVIIDQDRSFFFRRLHQIKPLFTAQSILEKLLGWPRMMVIRSRRMRDGKTIFY